MSNTFFIMNHQYLNNGEINTDDEMRTHEYPSCSHIMIIGVPLLLLVIIGVGSMYVSLCIIPERSIECDHDTYGTNIFNSTNRYSHTHVNYGYGYVIYHHFFNITFCYNSTSCVDVNGQFTSSRINITSAKQIKTMYIICTINKYPYEHNGQLDLVIYNKIYTYLDYTKNIIFFLLSLFTMFISILILKYFHEILIYQKILK